VFSSALADLGQPETCEEEFENGFSSGEERRKRSNSLEIDGIFLESQVR
jgi:hypothetical protein